MYIMNNIGNTCQNKEHYAENKYKVIQIDLLLGFNGGIFLGIIYLQLRQIRYAGVIPFLVP